MRIKMIGKTPLMMHNIRLADPDDPVVKEIKQITAKKTKKTDADAWELGRLEFSAALYWDPDLGPYIPGENVFKCLYEAAKATRKGKDVQRALMLQQSAVPLEYDGPRDVAGLWGDGWVSNRFVDRRIVNGTPNAPKPSMLPRVRPIFPEWSAEIDVEVDTRAIDYDVFLGIVASAGRIEGIGDYRRLYGRFESIVTE